MGRHYKWTPESLKSKMDEYFDKTPENEYTVTGLVLYIGSSKQSMADYEKRAGFKEIIQTAKLRVENAYEKDLRERGRSGDIFALKNFGWTDKTETEHKINKETYEHFKQEMSKYEKK